MFLTVFTPTYNRAHLLINLYESLCAQTCKDFEWLIVDDGSTDNTEETVREFIEKNEISIKYIRKENGGKHTAYNAAIDICNTELFFCVDSDDELTTDAVEIIHEEYKKNEYEQFLGMVFRKITRDGIDEASQYPDGIKAIGLADLYHNYSFTGELAFVFKTDLIKSYTFPVFTGEKFLTERVLFNKLNNIATMLLCNDKIYVYEYQEDGLTTRYKKNIKKCPYGCAYDHISEAYYGKKVVYKAKHYAAYKAFVMLFKIDKRKLRIDFSVDKVIIVLGNLFAMPCLVYLKYVYFR